MRAPAKLRAGVVGVGHLGQHHARLYSQLDGVELVGVCDRDAARAREVSAQWGGRVVAEAAELLGAVDVVSVATPTLHHAALATLFLREGVHTLVEKPIATTLDEADAMLAAAADGGATLQVGHTERYNPAAARARELVTAPRFIEAHRIGSFRPRSTDIDVVLDLMIHDLDVILDLVAAPVEGVEAVGVSALTDKVDIANARLRFASGCVANVTASRISTDRVRKLRIFQPRSYVSLDYANQQVRFFYLETASGAPRAEIRQRQVEVQQCEPLRREIESFLGCVRSGTAPLVGGAEGRAALELAHRILGSIAASSP